MGSRMARGRVLSCPGASWPPGTAPAGPTPAYLAVPWQTPRPPWPCSQPPQAPLPESDTAYVPAPGQPPQLRSWLEGGWAPNCKAGHDSQGAPVTCEKLGQGWESAQIQPFLPQGRLCPCDSRVRYSWPPYSTAWLVRKDSVPGPWGAARVQLGPPLSGPLCQCQAGRGRQWGALPGRASEAACAGRGLGGV